MKLKITIIMLVCLQWVASLQAQPGASLQRGLVAHYNFNANTKDKSGNKNHGYMSGGVSYDFDRFNNRCSAMRFDGSGFITVPSSASLKTPRRALTVSTWIKVYQSPGKSLAWLTVCCKGDRIDERTNSPQYRLQSTSVTVSVNTEFTEPADLTINYSQWYHYALVYDGSEVRTYLNGNEVFSYPYYETFMTNDRPLEIGRDMPGEIEYFVGLLDELRIYNRALNENEILELFYDETDRSITEVRCPGEVQLNEPGEEQEPNEPEEVNEGTEVEEEEPEPEQPVQPEVIEVIKRDTVYVPRTDTVYIPEKDTVVLTVRDTVVVEKRDTIYIKPAPDNRIENPGNQPGGGSGNPEPEDEPVNGNENPAGSLQGPSEPAQPNDEPAKKAKVLPENLKDGQINVGDHFLLEHVNFQQSTPIILPGSFEELDRVVELMKAYPKMEIELEGHTDAVGSGSKNYKLSKERVATVKAYIVRKGGIKSRRIQTKAFGERKPIAPNHNEPNRKKNRRVEMTILKM